ncbi:hypothetical protein [Thalassococcus sp. S3]|uniref:hypothetical protein n=1 Tax=Thalassococcus sp. S3 TaxID=2017482 RepID=UPI0010242804|nr:hypothetical protein [Thalassococcus sp. S3]QBF33703.1 hypothetical protein CFI11_21185 [Thalassococcus sp. S3]
MIRFLPLVMAANIFLSGCSSVVPTGVARLANVSPLTADPGAFAVALTLPDGLEVVEGSARIRFAAMRRDTQAESQATYVLRAAQVGERTLYRVDPVDLARFRAQQDLIKSWQAENEEATSGSFAVDLEACKRGDGPALDAKVSVAMQTRPDQPFFDIVRNAPVARILRDATEAHIGPCS